MINPLPEHKTEGKEKSMDRYEWIEHRKDGWALFRTDDYLYRKEKLFFCYLTARLYSLVHKVRLARRDRKEESKPHIDLYGNIIN